MEAELDDVQTEEHQPIASSRAHISMGNDDKTGKIISFSHAFSGISLVFLKIHFKPLYVYQKLFMKRYLAACFRDPIPKCPAKKRR